MCDKILLTVGYFLCYYKNKIKEFSHMKKREEKGVAAI